MSRTARFIPFDRRTIQPYEKCWAVLYDWPLVRDKRDRIENGYDGPGQTYYYTNYPPHGFRENFQRKTCKIAKRRWHKKIRYVAKREAYDYVED